MKVVEIKGEISSNTALQAGGRRFETCSAYIKNKKGLRDNLKPFLMSKKYIPNKEKQILTFQNDFML